MEFNKYQTPIEDLVFTRVLNGAPVSIAFKDAPKEVQDEFNECIATIPLVQWLISPDRPNIKDLPRDEAGKAIWKIEQPPIIEDIDYFRPTAIHFQQTGKFTDLRPNRAPGSEYMKWQNEEVRRIREGYLRKSDGAWIPGYMYWYLNYCPILITVGNESSNTGVRTMDFPEFWEGILWRFTGWDIAMRLGLNFGEISKRGASKAHPYCEKVITPEGEKLWKDIKIGDWLFGDDGIPTQVIDIPFDGEADIYKLTLRDGRTVLASDEHLWRLKVHNFKEEQIWSTNKIIQNYKRKRKTSERNPTGIEHICGIPANKAIDFQEKETKVDPYTFGLLLGDGCFRHKSCYFTCETSDFKIVSQSIPYEYTKWKAKFAYHLHIDNWMKILKDYGLWYKKSEDKFIPDEYKYNSKKVRLSLLKGLMDSDGYLDSKNTYCISTTSEKLASDIRWLCWSLGYNTLITKQKAGYKADGVYKECLPVYVITIHTYDVIATLPRKIKLGEWPSNYAKSHAEQTRITNIEYVGKMPAKCVTVNNASQCYLIGDFIVTHNSYTLASALAKIFIVGTRHDDVRSVGEKANSRGILMAYQKEFLNKSGTLNMFEDMADFIAQNTEFPRKRLKSSLSDMEWTMGYIDLNTGTKRGTGNQILGIAIKDDPDKGRGKRAELIGFEEFGKFPNVASVIKIAEPSVRDGDLVFGIIVCIGTGGEEGADFSGALDLIYHPSGSHFLSFENVWDKAQQQRGTSIFCFPAYVNRKGCYNKDGISDVTKALYALCFDRYIAKYENPDPFQITRTKAENPITLQDAIMKRDGAYFPVAQLTDRIQEIDLNPNFFDTILVGKFIQKSNGEVSFEPTGETPIHKFPTKDNKISGAVEISKLPEKKDGKVYSGRYIASCDPVDSDEADTMSLVSFFVLDTWTDSIVCEWTGRLSYADDCYELVRLGCIFYNAKLLYENNKKGLYGYFKKMNCLYILAETPEFLKDKDFIRGQKIGNSTYGVNATQPINNYARHLLREWILKPVTVQNTNTDEDEAEVTVTRLMTMWNRAALEEMRQWNENGNYDRVSSLGMLMLIREDRVVTLGDDFGKNNTRNDKDYLGNDPYFSRNYKVRIRQ